LTFPAGDTAGEVKGDIVGGVKDTVESLSESLRNISTTSTDVILPSDKQFVTGMFRASISTPLTAA